MCGAVELDHVEPVLRGEPTECKEEGRLGLFDGRASHRAGCVDDEDRFARQRRHYLVRCRGSDHQEAVGTVVLLLEIDDGGRKEPSAGCQVN